MARPLRIEFAGAVYHVVSRGNERRAIVRDENDRKRRLEWLSRTVETYGWMLHGFVLLRGREHLFIETPKPNLSAGMQYLNGSYTGYFNRRHRRAGHLFQGRFKGHLIEQQGYFLEISRYLHLLPVRAKIAARPEEYPWSSYGGFRRAADALEWLCYGRVLGEFGTTETQSRRRYVRFVQQGLTEMGASPFANAEGGLLLGSAEFIDRMRRLLARRPEDRAVPQLKALRHRPALSKIVKAAAGHFGEDPRTWRAGSRHDGPSRAVAAYIAWREHGYSATEVAEALGYLSHGSVRNAVLRIENGAESLKVHLKRISTALESAS
jgi:REP element-mobilizing transposase RayT